jgi:hypothetical protein
MSAEYDALRSECDRLIDRLHDGVDVIVDDVDSDAAVAALRKLRIALLRFAFRETGDPEAEEALAREGQSV